MHGGDIVAEVLKAQGTSFLFTLCGGHISPILVACNARGIRVVDTRHEATAVFAADAVARLTGRPGVAAGFGADGLRVEDPELVAETLERAKAAANAGRPVLVNVQLGKTDFRKGSISL